MDIIDHHSIGFGTAGSNPFKSLHMVKRVKLARSTLSSFLGKARYRVEYVIAVPALSATATPSASAISPSVAPSSMALA